MQMLIRGSRTSRMWLRTSLTYLLNGGAVYHFILFRRGYFRRRGEHESDQRDMIATVGTNRTVSKPRCHQEPIVFSCRFRGRGRGTTERPGRLHCHRWLDIMPVQVPS
ncbi:hypothetical protein BO86DRAFT_183145 [Aspergillus japonicus CBS 114.51]|uniref:Uncharacterized protein n=1 Tax=Aspergillus japonicus CBS 114.51 TaxID=1448312 RepID=A0A8T8WSI3_ASPJA|nr:hypothetical protein BO86DRAFT_183145 [Aspergillus japonicus CBS 114.51]RAH78299.1 hypothetical protein BO86DRAFT_183145 [Aspergillus japonicus CBS 114.51]